MKINLYHGTSEIFLNSIIEHGLGGINPNFHFKNLELFKFLAEKSEIILTNNSDYNNFKPEVLAIKEQRDLFFTDSYGNTRSVNYRHDGIYAADSREKAAIYCCDNKYGSEILEYCIKLYLLLKIEDKNFTLPEDLNLFKIENYIDIEHKPIIIEILNIEDDEVETESGKKGKDALTALRNAFEHMTPKQKFEELQYLNFKLLKAIPKNRLRIYEVEFSNRPIDGKFEFTLSEITCR